MPHEQNGVEEPHLSDVTTVPVTRYNLQNRRCFATVFNASPAILCIIQLDGLRYREINRAYEECTGYSRSEVLGKTSLKLGLWSNTHDRNRIIQKLLTEGRLSGRQAVFRTKKGERLTAEQIGVLRAWIDQGAVWPDSASVKIEDNRSHWAFKPPVRPVIGKERSTHR